MDPNLTALVIIGVVGTVLFALVFVLPGRKMPEEIGKTAIYQERCSAKWHLKLGFIAGGNLPIARVALYDDFIVVAFIFPQKILYREVTAVAAKRGFLSSSLTISLSSGRSLEIFTRNAEKMMQTIRERAKPKML